MSSVDLNAIVKMLDSGDDLSDKWRRCQLDAALKTTGGVMLGGLASLLFFRLRVWPVIFGGGIGLGLAYINCEQDINSTLKKEYQQETPK